MQHQFTDKRIRELPPWLVTQARHEMGGELVSMITPNGFVLDPRKAAFIYGNLFHVAGEWSEFPDVRLFVAENSYLCFSWGHGSPRNLDEGISIQTSILLRASDGMVFDKRTSQWHRKGYIHETATIVQERARGLGIHEIVSQVGLPYRARGYNSELVISWEMILTPIGLLIDNQVADEEFFVNIVEDSYEAILEYWCEDGHLSMRLMGGNY